MSRYRVALLAVVVAGFGVGTTGYLRGQAGNARSPAATAPAPRIAAGLGYYAILPQKLLLTSVLAEPGACQWTKESGPGEVTFERPTAAITWARVMTPGTYVFKVRTADGGAESSTRVNVYPPGAGFGNPIIPGMFADPHILFDGGVFYIFATSMENDEGSYGRAATWFSRDFVNWEMQLNNWPVYGQFRGDIWAPDILKKDGKYYQFITRSGGYDTWIAVADHPLGPWKNLRVNNTAIVGGGGNAGRIVPAYNMDAAPFVDDDGQAYMYWGWSEAMAAKLTPDLQEIDGEVHFLKGTKWVAEGGQLPQWLTVDLGESMPVTRVHTMPEFRNVAYGYKIEISDDNQAWRTFVDRSENRATRAAEGYDDKGDGAGRYVRITINSAGGHWAAIYGFDVYSGDRLVSRGKAATASTSRGATNDAARAVDGSTGPNLQDFVEGSYMVKRNGTYYLLYSSGTLHDGSYNVRYATAKHPLGPFVAPAQNSVLRSNADQTTRGPGHNSVLKFKDQYYIVYHQHNQPHEDGKLVFRQTCADRMEFNEDGTIKPVVPTQAGIGALQALVAQGEDVARSKYATASSVRGANYAAEYALDHNYASKWRAKDNSYPQTLTVDLGGTFEIQRIETSWEYPTLAYKYAIETSLDGEAWTAYVDKSREFPPVVSPLKDVKDARAAFVRIRVDGCERPENGAGIYALEVFRK